MIHKTCFPPFHFPSILIAGKRGVRQQCQAPFSKGSTLKRNGYAVQRLPVVSCLLESHSWHEAQKVIKDGKVKRGEEAKNTTCTPLRVIPVDKVAGFQRLVKRSHQRTCPACLLLTYGFHTPEIFADIQSVSTSPQKKMTSDLRLYYVLRSYRSSVGYFIVCLCNICHVIHHSEKIYISLKGEVYHFAKPFLGLF